MDTSHREANGLQWLKTRQHAAQRGESSSPDQIPEPVLNIVICNVLSEKTNKKYYKKDIFKGQKCVACCVVVIFNIVAVAN